MRPKIVHAGEEFAAELARHVLGSVRFDVLFERGDCEEGLVAGGALVRSFLLGVLQFYVPVE